jgi:hypothetical protein
MFNVPEKIVDYLVLYDIFCLLADGKGKETITVAADIDYASLDEICNAYFSFPGFEQDLDFNVRAVYLRSKHNRYAFISMASTLDRVSTERDFNKAFEINVFLDKVEKEMEVYYAS